MTAANTFYVTTPIYYVNDEPHIGHAYTTVLGDVLARFHRLFGHDTYYLTGNDEHGLKVQQAAQARNVTSQEHCDELTQHFQNLWKKLEISHDDFVRTTEPRHKRIVQAILQKAWDKGDIYKGSYTGWYNVREEAFVTEMEVRGLQDDVKAGRIIEIKEENYFFRLSKYQQWLIEYINEHPDFIVPESRRNEILGFLREPLNDLCISRPASRLTWGIPLPFDEDYVTYVWYDALINYVSAMGYASDAPAKFDRYWSNAVHLIGKDIIKPHCVYWPMMLRSVDVPPPRQILAHGWWCAPDGSKLSKTLHGSGLFLWLADQYGVDEFRYFLMRNMTIGQDSGVDEQTFADRVNSDMANDLGNLLSRSVKMVQQYCDGRVPIQRNVDAKDQAMIDMAARMAKRVRGLIERFEVQQAIEEVLSLIRATNRYIVVREPWVQHKEGATELVEATLYTCLEILRLSGVALSPIIPGKCVELFRQIGAPPMEEIPTWDEAMTWGGLATGAEAPGGDSLFPRIQTLKGLPGNESAKEQKPKPTKGDGTGADEKATEAIKAAGGLITFDDFMNVQFRVAEVLEAKKHPKADRLLILQVALGEERRQIVAGIANWYQPEDLIGLRVVVVANLKPAKLRGEKSEGMILAASIDDRLCLITTQDADFPSGSEVR